MHIVYYICNNESLPWIENLSNTNPDIATYVTQLRKNNYELFS